MIANIENKPLDVKLDALSKFMESRFFNLVTADVV